MLDTSYSLTAENVVRRLLSNPQTYSLFETYGLLPLEEPMSQTTKEMLYSLANLLLEHDEHIRDNTIEAMIDEEFLFDDLRDVFKRTNLPIVCIEWIFYNYKYAAVKCFFQKNYSFFLPNFDLEEINSREKLKIFLQSFLREFDVFSDVIQKLYEASDVDLVEEKYLSYLAQLVGYKKEDEKITLNISFRQFIKNIVEIYKMKGTNYALELYLNFLGFTTTINEFWFDRRFYYNINEKNDWTGISNPAHFGYYLTPNKPTMGIPSYLPVDEVIIDEDITYIRNLYEFNRLAQIVPIPQLLGYSPFVNPELYNNGETYTYFKTNYMSYELSKINNQGEIEPITAEELNILVQYINVFIPVFILKEIYLAPLPIDDFFDLNWQEGNFFTHIKFPAVDPSTGIPYPTSGILSDLLEIIWNEYMSGTNDNFIGTLLTGSADDLNTLYSYGSVGAVNEVNGQPFINTINIVPVVDIPSGNTYIRDWKTKGTTIGMLYNNTVEEDTLYQSVVDISIIP